MRLSDGAAWQYKNQPPNQLINVAGITEEHLYVQIGYTDNGGASWIARWRLASLPPLLPD